MNDFEKLTQFSKQELLDYVREHFPKDKASSKIKRLIMSSYTGRYIVYKNEKIELSNYSLDTLYSNLRR